MSVVPHKEPSKYCFECDLHFKLTELSSSQKIRVHVPEYPEKSPTEDFYQCPIDLFHNPETPPCNRRKLPGFLPKMGKTIVFDVYSEGYGTCLICGTSLGFNPATLAGYAIILQTST